MKSGIVATGMSDNDHKSQFIFKLDDTGKPEITLCPFHSDCERCRFVLTQYFHRLIPTNSRLVVGEYLQFYRINFELDSDCIVPTEWEIHQFLNEILSGMSEEGREMLFRDELLLSFSVRQSDSRFGEIDLSIEFLAKVQLKQQELSDLKFNVLFTDVSYVGTSLRCGYYYFPTASDYQKSRQKNFKLSEGILRSSDLSSNQKERIYKWLVQGIQTISIDLNNICSIPHFDLNLQFHGNHH